MKSIKPKDMLKFFSVSDVDLLLKYVETETQNLKLLSQNPYLEIKSEEINKQIEQNIKIWNILNQMKG